MWTDCSKQTDFCAHFAAESYPTIVVINPGKRKRFHSHGSEMTEESVQKTLDKIVGGDAKFVVIKGNKIAALVE